MKIEVKPLERSKWHGKKGAESFTRDKTLNVLVDGETRQYATGLDYVNKVFTDPDDSKRKLTEAEYYGKLLKVDLSNQFIDGVLHSFWDSKTAKIKLKNSTMILDTNLPLDYIKIKALKASKFVANSMKDWEDGNYPEASHVITDEEEEIEIKASKLAIKKSAIIESSKLSLDKKIQIILIISGQNMKGKSNDFVEVELDKITEKNPTEVLRHIKMDSKEMSLHAMILEALQKNVLRKEGHKILYIDSVIGSDIYDVIEYFTKDENQDLKLRILASINN
jgi:hypothetical protein